MYVVWHFVTEGCYSPSDLFYTFECLFRGEEQRIEFRAVLDTVSTARGSGWVKPADSKSMGISQTIIDPPATAGGTDPFQVRFLT